MSYELGAELAPAMAELAAQAAEGHAPARDDWQAVRTASFTTSTSDGQDEIELRWYTKTSAAPGSAVVYAHGGGMIGGSLDLYDKVVAWYVAQTGVPFLSVGYRLGPRSDQHHRPG
jgi:acetyl esterase/lipase